MVRRTALRGYRAAPLFTPAELADLMDARLMTQPTNAFLACSHSDFNLSAQLEEAIDDLKATRRGSSFSEFRAYWEATNGSTGSSRSTPRSFASSTR